MFSCVWKYIDNVNDLLVDALTPAGQQWRITSTCEILNKSFLVTELWTLNSKLEKSIELSHTINTVGCGVYCESCTNLGKNFYHVFLPMLANQYFSTTLMTLLQRFIHSLQCFSNRNFLFEVKMMISLAPRNLDKMKKEVEDNLKTRKLRDNLETWKLKDNLKTRKLKDNLKTRKLKIMLLI